MGDPMPPSPSTIRGLQPPPPRDGQFGQMFQSSHRWSHPSPAPPAQPQPLLLGQNNRVLVKISVCVPPNVSRSIHTTAHGVTHVGSCSALGVAGTRGCGGCLCVSSKTSISPSPRSRPGDPTVGDSTLAEPLHPGLHCLQPRPPGSSRGAWGAQAVKPRRQSSPAHTCSCRGNIQPQDMAAPETRLLCFPSLLCHRHSWVPLVSAVPVPVSPTPGSLGPALGGTGRRLYCSQKCIVNEL